VGPGDLEKILSGLPEETAPELLSSLRTGEDAGVYLISEGLAIVQTVDFFPPIVDDPYTFGQITAANALSDVYAMGGKPLTALNIVAFPCGMDLGVLEQVLRGGHHKVHEAGAVIVGGHTIDDDEMKYGLAVTGLVDPAKITAITGAHPGDVLVLTKPVGTGILATALKAELLTEEEMGEAVSSMCSLNREAAEILGRYTVNACTDITGFGLAGHLYEMVKAGGVSAELLAGDVPLFERTLEMASMGMVPEGTRRNFDYAGGVELPAGKEDDLLLQCIYDPQTSGGLLAAVDKSDADSALQELRRGPCPRAAAVGTVLEGPGGTIRITRGRSG
jgi:selenide,water dikinase